MPRTTQKRTRKSEQARELSEDERHPALGPLPAKDSTKPTAFDRLPWVPVKLPELIGDGLGFEADGGMLGLEELDGNVWQEIKAGRAPESFQLKAADSDEEEEFKGCGTVDENDNGGDEMTEEAASGGKAAEAMASKKARRQAKKGRLAAIGEDDVVLGDVNWSVMGELEEESEEDHEGPVTTFDDALLPAWTRHQLTPVLKHALHTLAFFQPTPVQDATLSISLDSSTTPPRDLVAIAETGSGKTLAYALPILNTLTSPNSVPVPHNHQDLPVKALILTPTRELCLQVKVHIDSVLVAMSSSNDTSAGKNRSGISTVAICGGIAIAKQRKQLEKTKKLFESQDGRKGSILVATPGRLWDLIQTWDALSNGIRTNLDWLIIDEADKMIEKGHFEQLDKILKLVHRPNRLNNGDWKDDWGQEDKIQIKENIRTMVFSATMDKHLQINLKKNRGQIRLQNDDNGKGGKDPLEDLLERIDFRDDQPQVVDLSPQGHLAGGLKECKIECLLKDKDLYLFHFLLRYSGRTLVFLSSISALRRLAPLLTLLVPNSSVLTLHSGMQQRARLKSLDKFRSTTKSILLSTDVAARGLDIPLVDHVVHYQIPRTVDCYVHRSGRTARAGRDGVALVLVGPDELKVWRGLMKSLNRVDNLPSPPIEHSISSTLKELLVLAKKIDGLEHQSSKQAHDTHWTKKTAEILDIDQDEPQYDSDNNPLAITRRDSKATTLRVRSLKAELATKLSQPILLPRTVIKQKRKRGLGTSNCFITDPLVMQRLLEGQSHEKVVGLDKDVSALKELEDVKSKGKLKRKKK